MKTFRQISVLLLGLLAISTTVHSQWVQSTAPEVRWVVSLGVHGNTLFAGCSGTDNLFRSTDDGNSWTLIDSSMDKNARINAFASIGDRIFAAGSGGLWHSTDNGSTWQEDSIAGYPVVLPGVYIPDVYSLAAKDSTLFVGTNYGVFRSPDKGLTWSECNTGLGPNHMVEALAVQDTNLFAGIGAYAVCRSTNGGESWTIMDNEFPPNTTGYSTVSSMTVTQTHLFAGLIGDCGVASSTNRGESWKRASVGLTDTSVWSLATDGSAIFAGTESQGVFVSTDNGSSWKKVSDGLPSRAWVHSLAVHGRYLFAGLWDPKTGGAGIWRRPLSEILSGNRLDYFPMHVGDVWYYNLPAPVSDPWHWRTIRDSLSVGNRTYYTWRYGDGVDIIDTVRCDSVGNVWQYSGGKEYLRFDFQADSGATYPFELGRRFGDSVYTWKVYVYTDVREVTPIDTFQHCTRFHFEIAGVTDTDQWYTFAPHIGLVVHMNDGWGSDRLTGVVLNGETILSAKGSEGSPISYKLFPNYPNPFNPSTRIGYSLPSRSLVTLDIFNTLGQHVATLVHGEIEAGYHEVQMDASAWASGVYFYRLQAENFTATKTLILLK
jgi:photosystem II stability/assembly factor-like uncharacterized protein